MKQITHSAEAYHKLKAIIDIANQHLQQMNHQKHKVPADLMADVEIFLTDSPGWFLSVIEGRDKNIKGLERELDDLSDVCNNIIAERNELRLKLEEPMGLSLGNQKKLRSLGVENLSDLINNYRKLQIQVSGPTERRFNPADSDSSLDQKEEWQMQQQLLPKVLQQGLQQDVLIGTNVLQNDICWIEALEIALGYGAQDADADNGRNGTGIGYIAPPNGRSETCFPRGKCNNVSLYRDNCKAVSLSRDNFNIVSRVSKNFIVKDGKSDSQRPPKETTTVMQDAKQLQVKKRKKKVTAPTYLPKESSRGNPRQQLIKKPAELSTRGNSYANVKKCDATICRVIHYKRRTYFNSNYAFSDGYITAYGNDCPKDRGTNTGSLLKSSADVDPNWRNGVPIPCGHKRKWRNESADAHHSNQQNHLQIEQ